MSLEELQQLQVIMYTVMAGILVVLLYGYIIYMYRSEKKGEKDFEKYSSLVLDDEIDSDLLERNLKNEKEKKE